MASVEDLPPDIRAQISGTAPAPSAGPSGRPFIGSAHPAYPASKKTAQPPQKAEPQADDAKDTQQAEGSPCVRCKARLVKEAAFCHNCGLDLQRKRAAETLGIEISDEDVEAYLFKGYLVKEVALFGSHKATFKSIQSKEVDEADALTETHFKDRRPTDIEWVNYRSKILIAFGLAKVDGLSIGAAPKDRLEYLQDHGSQFVEVVGKKFGLFNQAIGEVLNGDILGKS